MGATAAVVMGAGAGIQAIGAIESGKAAGRAADFNRSITLENAKIFEQQTQADVISLRKQQYKQMGAIRAAVGASGVTMDGSVLDVLEDSVMEATLDIQRLEYSGQIKQRELRNDARFFQMQGDAAKTSSYYSAASDLLMGGGRMAFGADGKGGYYTEGKPVQVAGSPR